MDNQFIITAGDYITQPVGPFASEEEAHIYYGLNKPQGIRYLSAPTIQRLLTPHPTHLAMAHTGRGSNG